MQTQSAAPAATDKSTGSKVFYAIFGAMLVVCYLLTFWIFLNGLGLITGGGRTTATVTGVADANNDGTPGAVTTLPANGNNFNVNTKEAASQYTFHFKTADGQLVEKAYVTTAYDLGEVGSQVNVIYNRNKPEEFIVDGFLPIFYYIGKNCLLFVTLTILIIVALVRWRIKKNRTALVK